MNPDAAQNPREELEVRLTALLLGDLPELEADAVRRAIAADPALAALHRRLKETIELVRETAANPAGQTASQPEPLKLNEERREKLFAKFKTVAPKELSVARPRQIAWWVPMGIAAILMAIIGVALLPPRFVLARAPSPSALETVGLDLTVVPLGETPRSVAKKYDVASDGFGLQPPTPPTAPVTGELAAGDRTSVRYFSSQPAAPAGPGKQIADMGLSQLATSSKSDDFLKSQDKKSSTTGLPGAGAGFNGKSLGGGAGFGGGGASTAEHALGLVPAKELREESQSVVDMVFEARYGKGPSIQRPAVAAAAPSAITAEGGRRANRSASRELVVEAKFSDISQAGDKSFGSDRDLGGPLSVRLAAPFGAAPNAAFFSSAKSLADNLWEESQTKPINGRTSRPGAADADVPTLGDWRFDRIQLPAAPTAPADKGSFMYTGEPTGGSPAKGIVAIADGEAATSPQGLDVFFATPGGAEVLSQKSDDTWRSVEALTSQLARTYENGAISGTSLSAGLPGQEISLGFTANGNIEGFAKTKNPAVSSATDDLGRGTSETASQSNRELRLNELEARATTAPGRGKEIALAQEVDFLAANGVADVASSKQRGAHEADPAILYADQSLILGREVNATRGQTMIKVEEAGSPSTKTAQLDAGKRVAFMAPIDKASAEKREELLEEQPGKKGAKTVEDLASFSDEQKQMLYGVEHGSGTVFLGGEFRVSPRPEKDVAASAQSQVTNVFSVNAVGYTQANLPKEVQLMAGRSSTGIALPEIQAESAARQSGLEMLAKQTTRERLIAPVESLTITTPPGKPAVVADDDGRAIKQVAPALIPQPEVQTRDNSFSTFSLNVSDVSFKLAAASLEKGVMPDLATVRSEEFINAFDYRDPAPPAGVPVGFAWDRARYPFAHNRDLLRFSIKTAAAGRETGRPLNLVLLLDNSGSMERADRVGIVHEALRILATQLQAQDKISVVTFARTARLWADGASGSQAGQIAEQVGGITPEGGTNLEEAMNLAYQTARRHYLANGMNRVVLLTDGAANLGNTDAEALKQKVEAQRKQGIALDCFGIGWEGFNDDLLENLSRNGDGRYGFINTVEEAGTEFASQLAGALHVAASDVKVQIEFNPRRVTAYRQIGYAKHQLTKEQFRDNTVDAAEIAAAESGNSLYTIETNPQGEGPIATVRVRFKIPGTTDYREHEWTVPFSYKVVSLEQAGPTMRLAATASAFSEWLGASPFASDVTPDRLLGYLRGVPEVYGADGRPKKLEWMIRQAKSVAGK